MKSFIFTLMVSVFSLSLCAQTLDIKPLRKIEKSASGPNKARFEDSSLKSKKSDTLSIAEKNAFLHTNIPSIIGKSGIAPAFFDNLAIGLADDKFSFSTGTFTDTLRKTSFGGSLTASAPNGSRELFSPRSKAPYDFGLELKRTWEFGTTKWMLLQDKKLTDTISSVSNKWINLSFSGNLAKSILFQNDTLNETKSPFTFEALINFNYLFNSFVIKRYVNRRILFNAGIGYGRFTNYSELDEVTLRKGKIFENNQFSETEVVSGRKGDYREFHGMVLRAAIFKPLTDPFALTNVHIGITASSFGIGSIHHLLNANAGVYFSKWKTEEDEEDSTKKVLKELFSVGLIADFKNLQNVANSNYARGNFKILLTAQIPLNFF